MLNLMELEQLVAFADCGRLSAAAEKLNISQPTLTRTMQHLEDAFGVPLFERSKNRIALNETGMLAVRHARQLLEGADQAVKDVRTFDRSLRTITVSSCAPAPLWRLLPALSTLFPEMAVSSSIKSSEAVLADLRAGGCQLAVLSEPIAWEGFSCVPFMKERLNVCVPKNHALAGLATVTFSELNGYNFLLASELGFWDDMCRREMPASRFLVQPDAFALQELIRESAMPCFTTDLTGNREELAGRNQIPITDSAANITYQLAFHQKSRQYAERLLKQP